jgi:hypothetical protein
MMAAIVIGGYLLVGGALFAPDGTRGTQVGPAGEPRCAGERGDAVLAEVSMFYRDLHAKQWAALVDHFWPAKIAARRQPPVEDPAWQNAPLDRSGAAAGSSSCTYAIDAAVGAPASAEIRVVAQWARVLVSRPMAAIGSNATEVCLEEFWLYSLNGRWKIVHLASAAHGTPGPAAAR